MGACRGTQPILENEGNLFRWPPGSDVVARIPRDGNYRASASNANARVTSVRNKMVAAARLTAVMQPLRFG